MVAKTSPMGWNSWDCYGAAVNEEQLRGNAEYMAKYLKNFGWEYVVCDIQWYEPTANSNCYHNFADLEMDGYSRLIPAVNRFPSAAHGKEKQFHELWSGERFTASGGFETEIPPHGAKLFRVV